MKIKIYDGIAYLMMAIAILSFVLGAYGNMCDKDHYTAVAMITLPVSAIIFVVMCVVRPTLRFR